MSSQPPAKKRARHQVSLSNSSLDSSTVPAVSCPGSSILVDPRLEVSLTAEDYAGLCTGKKSTNRCPVVSIDKLPDEVLLAIFDFCVKLRVDEDPFTKKGIKAWQLLVHVCRRWRSIVFGSPRGLGLQLVCTSRTPARDMLDVWPALPLLIWDHAPSTEGFDNIIAVLEHSDRVCQIDLHVPSSHLENVLAAMKVPFPELTELGLFPFEKETVLPDSFLGEFAPRLQVLLLDRVSFPGLPKLILSATHLVTLHLENIPHSGYISPNAIVTALSTLASLEQFWIGFQSPRSCPDLASRRLHPPTRTVLPALTRFGFRGASEYLEALVDRVDAPQLGNLYITFFNDIVFDTPHFIQFISRTPTLKAFKKACVVFGDDAAEVNLSSRTSDFGELEVKILCRGLDWQVSSLGQVCSSSLPPFSTLEELYIGGTPYWQPHLEGEIENTMWLELLRPYTAVRNVYLLEEFAPHIVPPLKELVGDRTTEVLPTLRNLFLYGSQPSGPAGPAGPAHEGIMQFIAARQVVTGYPMAVKFQCPVPECGSAFTRHFNLKAHLRSHSHEKLFHCTWPGCGKSFARLHDCKRHEQLHSNPRPFTCDGCRKPFARLDALDRHLLSEGGSGCLKVQEPNPGKKAAVAVFKVEPDVGGQEDRGPVQSVVARRVTPRPTAVERSKFQCPVPGCGSTFTRHFNLKGHLRSHNEEKPFLCKWPGCGKGFSRQHDCKRHEQLHSNHRPFICEGCKKPFARLDALNRHLRSEGGSGCLKVQEMNPEQQVAVE